MTLILIIFCIWGASALVRASKEAARMKENTTQATLRLNHNTDKDIL